MFKETHEDLQKTKDELEQSQININKYIHRHSDLTEQNRNFKYELEKKVIFIKYYFLKFLLKLNYNIFVKLF